MELCAVLGKTRWSFYKHFERKHRQEELLKVVVREVQEVRKDEPRVGTRKLHHRISPKVSAETGRMVGRDKLFEVLRERDLLVKPKKRFERTTYSAHQYAVAPNLINDLEISRPNQVFVSDITYINLWGGFAYLFLVTDAYSRKIVGYHLSRDLSHHSAIIALEHALSRIKDPEGIIHHSDRGCQYCCHEFMEVLAIYGMRSSMTEESHCYQNAIAERVNGILKGDLNIDAVFPSFGAAAAAIRHAIKVYNTKRTHWSLGLKTPSEVYQQAA